MDRITPIPPARQHDPRVSILIPNYNNGRQSSRSGDHDLIGDLLESLLDTLKHDTTAFEIIAYDDGSTDDSLETLRHWSKQTWPDDRPFLQLIEAEHTGILAKTANLLTRRATGDILARLDGDTVCLTPNWVTHLTRIFDNAPPRLGVVGPKQLRPDMLIHAMGDWVLHPNGYSHVASGLDRYAMIRPIEVDHVMGCFYCYRREVFDDIGGYDENFLRGQTVDFGLQARLKGWRCFAVPDIEFIHCHGMRTTRKSTADTEQGVIQSLNTFEKKWGFNRIAPDLDQVRARYAGTALLWNARWFGTDTPDLAAPPIPDPTRIDATDWGRYAKDPAFRQTIDLRVALTADVIRQTETPTCALLLGSRLGLIAHLLAIHGVPITSFEPTAGHAEFARKCTKNHQYPAGPPTFLPQTSRSIIPLEDHQADLALVFDQLETHPNPVALIKEVHRVLAPEKILALTSQRRPAREDAPTDHEHRYVWQELVTQIQVAANFAVTIDPTKDDLSHDMIVIARRKVDTTKHTSPTPAKTDDQKTQPAKQPAIA